MGHVIWQNGPGNVLSADLGTFRLTIQSVMGTSGEARYMVFRQGAQGEAGSLVRSGVKDSVRCAMNEAEQIMSRWDESLTRTEGDPSSR